MTTQFVTNVRREARGRMHLQKAVEAVEKRIHTPISSFDVYVDSENNILLRPKREIPASLAIEVTAEQARYLTNVVDQHEAPNHTLLASALDFADRLHRGEIVSDLPTQPVETVQRT